MEEVVPDTTELIAEALTKNSAEGTELEEIGIKKSQKLREEILSEGVRRSERDPRLVNLERSDVKKLLKKIVSNDPETVVLKIKNHLIADVSSAVLDAIIKALRKNRVCQALYAQNLVKAMTDVQLLALTDLCRRKKIWCLNIGENYNVSTHAWEMFCKALPETYITHMYVSEHTIKIALKNEMRMHIRANRKKHDLHCSMRNLQVISRCTNMWWNPINSIRKQLEASSKADTPSAKRQKLPLRPLHAGDTAYWAEGRGEGGNKPWKFSCMCGETCSSYENFRYHPVGRMFECTRCSLWSHVSCVLGNITDEELDEQEDALCFKCHTAVRRQRLAELRDLKKTYSGSELSKLLRGEGGGEGEGEGEEARRASSGEGEITGEMIDTHVGGWPSEQDDEEDEEEEDEEEEAQEGAATEEVAGDKSNEEYSATAGHK